MDNYKMCAPFTSLPHPNSTPNSAPSGRDKRPDESVPMRMFTLERHQRIARPIDDVFAFFSRAENLQDITPAWLDFGIVWVSTPELQRGTLIRYALRWRSLPVRWTTEIIRWEPPVRFVDQQISGPYKLWHHEHRFERQGSATLMHDTVRYALPFGVVGAIVHATMVGRDVNSIFDYRAERIRALFA
jgi:ligand-binding SRPBCC domain-containing protein